MLRDLRNRIAFGKVPRLRPFVLLVRVMCRWRWELSIGGRVLACLLTYLLTYLITYLLTYLLTPWSRVLLEKLTDLQLIKKFPAFYRTPKFITVLTSARHLSLSWAKSMQSPQPLPTSWRSILILPSHLRLVLLSGSFPQVSPPIACAYLSHPPYLPHAPSISFF